MKPFDVMDMEVYEVSIVYTTGLGVETDSFLFITKEVAEKFAKKAEKDYINNLPIININKREVKNNI